MTTFTFHYVSILIIPLLFTLVNRSLFTFHYVSILIVCPISGDNVPIIFTFHYVSILMKCSEENVCTVRMIYIPLCLYFNFYDYDGTTGFDLIYIPLCLYFNRNVVISEAATLEFTFHYVSILIHCRYCRSIRDLIYIPLCLYFNVI